MQQRMIGGRTVNPIGLGCMGLTWAYIDHVVDESEAIELVRTAIESGVDHLDTSDVYGPFTNESIVGKGIADHRAEVLLATKAGLVANPETREVGRDGTPDHLRAACDASLRRLGVDHIDLWYLHRPDPAVPLEESWGAMAEMVEAGKVRLLGISEATVEQLDAVHAIHPVSAVQSELSLWTRDYLTDVVPWCGAHGVAFVAFSPLGRGFLTGAIDASTTFANRDFRARLPRFAPEALAANQGIVDAVAAIAAAKGVATSQIALAWVLAQGDHVHVIPGTKRRAYLESNLAAGSVTLTADELAQLDALPAPVGGRY